MVFEICLDGVVKAKNESSPFPTKAFKKVSKHCRQ